MHRDSGKLHHLDVSDITGSRDDSPFAVKNTGQLVEELGRSVGHQYRFQRDTVSLTYDPGEFRSGRVGIMEDGIQLPAHTGTKPLGWAKGINIGAEIQDGFKFKPFGSGHGMDITTMSV